MDKNVSPSPPKTPIDKLNYEQAFNELEEIVNALESSEHSLDQALALFKRGQDLIQHCTDLLDEAELKVRQIIGTDISDFPVEQDE